MDDYFAECEEHLTAIRRNLLTIEAQAFATTERPIIDELFRSFHTLKGLSGMVGLKKAERLAHEMESYLRLVRENKARLNPVSTDALIAATKTLEQVIANRRNNNISPDIEHTINHLKAAFSETAPHSQNPQPKTAPTPPQQILPSVTLKPQEEELLKAATASGGRAWQFEFTPETHLAAKGINVNNIRARLQGIGELIHGSPRISTNGSIVFDFVVISNLPSTTFSGWQNDGLNWMAYEPAEPTPTEQATETPPPVETAPPEEPIQAEELVQIEAPPSTSQQTPPLPPTIVRVDLAKLDELMRMVGELVIERSRLTENIQNLKQTLPTAQWRELLQTNLALERQLRDLREGIMRVRLVPVGELFTRMQFVIRDLMRDSQKNISLEMSGQNTEIDKFVIDRMIDPLLHLVRNAVSHGIESISERIKLGKPQQGKISLRAFTSGEMVVLEIEDDGRGIDTSAVEQKAKTQGLISPHTELDQTTLLEILCQSGFSTRSSVDLTSGRGIGMAVVKNTIFELGGFLAVHSIPHCGTRFTIHLPLTLAIADALIIKACSQTFAIPQSAVREVLQISPASLSLIENQEILPYRNVPISLLRLNSLFNLSPIHSENLNNGKTQAPSPKPPTSTQFLSVVVLGNNLTSLAIVVDHIIGLREIVVRPLSDPLIQVTGIAGATELGDKRVVLILDPPALLQLSHRALLSRNR
nr:chemotaxis protein CheA [Ancylothrix sp. D3o]